MTRRGALAIAALAVVLGLGLAASPARADSRYADANRAYAAGDYEAAIRGYQALVDAGVVHEDLFYNLGNAHFRVGALGPAIYDYERALRVDPDMDDARHNLAVARQAVAAQLGDRGDRADRLEGGAGVESLWIRVITHFSLGGLAWMFLALNALVFAGLIALRLTDDGVRRSLLRVATAFAGAALLCCGALFAAHIVHRETARIGIALPDRLVMRESADRASTERARIHAGVRVHIGRRKAGWVQIRLTIADRGEVQGWVPADTVGAL